MFIKNAKKPRKINAKKSYQQFKHTLQLLLLPNIIINSLKGRDSQRRKGELK